MRQGSGGRRTRGRGNQGGHTGGHNNRRPNGGQNKNSAFDSTAPGVKIRGTAQQVQEKYLNLARDNQRSGDRVLSETYFQFAEHYGRIVNNSCNPEDKPIRADSDGGEDGENVPASEGAVDLSMQEQPDAVVPIKIKPGEPKPAPVRTRRKPKEDTAFVAEGSDSIDELDTLPDFLKGTTVDSDNDDLFGLADEKL